MSTAAGEIKQILRNVFASFGCHPHFTGAWMERQHLYFEELKKTMSDDEVKAIGEMGLDYSHKNYEHHELQKTLLRIQLKLAIEYQKPIVIHCKNFHKSTRAEDDCLEELRHNRPRFIHRHRFIGDLATANRWSHTFDDLYFGFTPAIYGSSANDGMVKVIQNLPLNRILVDTDAPFF